MKEKYFYDARVTRVVDGDTVDVIIDIGFGIHYKTRVRMLGYDAPETYRPKTKREKKKGLLVAKYLSVLVEENKDELFIQTHKKGKYGRYLGEIYYKRGKKYISINTLVLNYMVMHGLLKKKKKKK